MNRTRISIAPGVLVRHTADWPVPPLSQWSQSVTVASPLVLHASPCAKNSSFLISAILVHSTSFSHRKRRVPWTVNQTTTCHLLTWPAIVNQTNIRTISRQRWGNVWEMGLNAHGIFPQRMDTILKWTDDSYFALIRPWLDVECQVTYLCIEP